MTGHDTPNLPPDNSDLSFDSPPIDLPESNPGKPAVTPLFLTPKEKRDADEHTPPGLSNPFWR